MRASADALVASLADACRDAFSRLVPGVNLRVLGDEFLSADCEVRVASQVKTKSVSARFELSLGMEQLVASLEVAAGETKRYPVITLSPNHSWLNLFGSMTVTSRRVVIRAIPNEFTAVMRRGQLEFLDNGSASTVRRFVVNVDAEGTQRLVQKWEFTGPRGVPKPGTALG